MPSRGRLLKIVLGLAVSAALLVYLFWHADLRAVGARLLDTHWGFLAASIALNLGSLWARTRRWSYLFPPGPPPAGLFNAVMIGYMANNLLRSAPARSFAPAWSSGVGSASGPR